MTTQSPPADHAAPSPDPTQHTAADDIQGDAPSYCFDLANHEDPCPLPCTGCTSECRPPVPTTP